MVFLPTGDGMIICLHDKNESPLTLVKLAEELHVSLRESNSRTADDEWIIVRMGIHSGTGAYYPDINGNLNIAGTVANMTQRVTSFGEGWHVVASKNAFDDIASLDKQCQRLFHRLGFGEAKHKTPVEVYNVYREEEPAFGNPARPPQIQEIEGVSTQTG